MEPWTVRTFVRAGIATALACLAAVGTALVGDQSISPAEWVAVGTATLGAFAGWLGIGAAPGPGSYTEPFLNSDKTDEQVPVPKPPAVPTADA